MKFLLTSIYANVAEQLPSLLTKKSEDTDVAFIATAADVYEDKSFVEIDREKLVSQGFKVKEIKLETFEQIKTDLDGCDVIFVAGGNTFYLLQETRKSGFDSLLKDLLSTDKIYVGSSAGSVLVGPDIGLIDTLDDPIEAPELKNYLGLSLIDFVVLPHYGKQKYEEKYQKIIQRAVEKSIKTKTLTDNEFVIV